MKNLFYLLSVTALLFIWVCSNQSTITEKELKASITATDHIHKTEGLKTKTMASAAEIMARKQVPVLCYHHIKEVVGKNSAGYDVTIARFKEQMKALADSGYKTVTPDQLYNYLAYGGSLPEKPVMITYDDTDEEQFTIAKPEMDKYGFKGVYFIMTISIGRPRYMTKEQIKQLSDEGHVIGGHTWDHHRVDRYLTAHAVQLPNKKEKIVNDWDEQLAAPRKKLEELIGKP